jgi:hypothetical protein
LSKAAVRSLALCAVLVLASGCWTTRWVKTNDLRSLGGSLDDSRPITSVQGEHVEVDGQMLVRLTLVDGGSSDWVSAGDIFVSKEGIYFEAGITTRQIARVTVSNLSPVQIERLKALAPPGDQVTSEPEPDGESYRLEVTSPADLIPWISRFVVQQRAHEETEGLWSFERQRRSFLESSKRNQRTFPVSFSHLASPVSAGDQVLITRGASWSQVQSVEINTLDTFYSALAIPLFPVALLFSPNNQGRASEALPSIVATSAKEVWPVDGESLQPLYSVQGRRRAIVKVVGGVDGGATSKGDWFSSATVGVRLWKMLDCAFLARELSLSPASSGDSRNAYRVFGAAGGLHIDSDGDPRFAFYLGFEILESRSARMSSLVLGPRFGFGSVPLYLAVPLGVTSTCRANGVGACVGDNTSVYVSAQVGFAY